MKLIDLFEMNARLQYWQGWNAFHDGKSEETNPYTKEQLAYRNMWLNGWRDAAEEAIFS